MALINDERALPLQKPYETGYADLWWDTYQHVDVIRTYLRLYDLHLLPFAKSPQYFSYFLPLLLIKYLPPKLWRKYNMVFTVPFCM